LRAFSYFANGCGYFTNECAYTLRSEGGKQSPLNSD
jgi:hypothetical protein